MKQGNIILILSSPSGAGKTTLAKKILSLDSKFVNSVSVTTRKIRPNEVEGKDYFFVAKEKFQEMIDNHNFLEVTEIYGNSYGSPISFVTEKMAEGFDVIFDIDSNGAEEIKDKMGDLVVSIFILPPSLSELKNRLRERNSENEADLLKRFNNAKVEIFNYKKYDYVLVNKNFDETVENILSIIRAERLRHSDYSNFVSNL